MAHEFAKGLSGTKECNPTKVARVEPLACSQAESLPLWSMHATRTIKLPRGKKEKHIAIATKKTNTPAIVDDKWVTVAEFKI